MDSGECLCQLVRSLEQKEVWVKDVCMGHLAKSQCVKTFVLDVNAYQKISIAEEAVSYWIDKMT